MKKLFYLISAILLLASCASPALAGGEKGSSNYLYSPYGETLPVPPAYTHARSITAGDLEGVDSLQNLTCCFVTDEYVYVLADARLILLHHDLTVAKVFTDYADAQGARQALSGCTGVYVTGEGEIYICQSEQARILHLDAEGALLREIGRPDITGFESVKYRPSKMTMDQAGRIYVVAKGMYEGIVQLNPDGSFSRFYGVNEVSFTVGDLIWRLLATEEQRSRQQLWLPTDFTNVCIDKDGFIFATIQGSQELPIKRLNSKGENILRVDDDKAYPIGDEWTAKSGYGIPVGYSQFIACDANEYGVYIALDSVRSRVFAYNEDSKLLFVFGGPGDREGYFRNPIDADFVGDQILVLDQLAQSIEVFSPTLYGQALAKAVKAQYNYDYESAAGAWREALSYNHNLTIAYSGIGRSLIREEKYDEALEYLRRGDDRKYYTKAFEKVRNQTLRRWFVPIVGALAGLIVLIVACKLIKRRKRAGREAAA